MSHNPSNPLLNASPYYLRSLVLDYLCHQGCPKTARIFARDSATRNLDADGDEIMSDPAPSSRRESKGFELTENIERMVHVRKEIRSHIQRGQVDEAIQMLDTHFPKVLSTPVEPRSTTKKRQYYIPPTSVEPSHLNINLRILAFIESIRTRPLPDTRDTDLMDNPFQRVSAVVSLEKAIKLRALAILLPTKEDRERYDSELEAVIGLMAYPVPEASGEISRYLSQERRDAVADSIDAAILHSLGSSSISQLELYTRYTSACWTTARVLGAQAPPGALLPPNWPSKETKTAQPPPKSLPFTLKGFIESKPSPST